ncbi:PREDICTED: protein FAM3A isoform X1 [Capra hircus]|uniref:protein FAM3A isoform X1 n=1 Tax=Capra hircus TaxID=9925 RepID=UPI000846CDA2|nr:PREDICTED: protein FAM3A isoform X1 [Capra hircus]
MPGGVGAASRGKDPHLGEPLPLPSPRGSRELDREPPGSRFPSGPSRAPLHVPKGPGQGLGPANRRTDHARTITGAHQEVVPDPHPNLLFCFVAPSPECRVPKGCICRLPQPNERSGHEVGRWVASTVKGSLGKQTRLEAQLPRGPLRIVALVITVAVTWIVVSILLGGLGFPRIQQLFASQENSVTAEPRARKYKCGLPQPCPEEHLAFRVVSGAANVIGPKICLEDRMLMSSVKDNVGRGLNIALVNGVNGDLIEARAFDMWAGDVNDLLKFIRPLHEGTLVFVASYDDPATKMNEETRKLFSDLGSKNVKDLAFRDSWVFVGAKGVQNKSPFEQHMKNSKHTNKYEGWPEALEMEGCIPRRPTAS